MKLATYDVATIDGAIRHVEAHSWQVSNDGVLEFYQIVELKSPLSEADNKSIKRIVRAFTLRNVITWERDEPVAQKG